MMQVVSGAGIRDMMVTRGVWIAAMATLKHVVIE
jgi:hypothetical protein